MSNAVQATNVITESTGEMRAIQESLQGLKFGVVSIIVQDGVIVQIDRTEKRRFRRKSQAELTGLVPPST